MWKFLILDESVEITYWIWNMCALHISIHMKI